MVECVDDRKYLEFSQLYTITRMVQIGPFFWITENQNPFQLQGVFDPLTRALLMDPTDPHYRLVLRACHVAPPPINEVASAATAWLPSSL